MALITVNDLTFAYEGSYDNVFENLSFSVDTDWKIGFVGRNGRGKTTFLRILMGDYTYTGSIACPVSFAYFPFAVADERQWTEEIVSSIAPGYAQWQLRRELSLLGVDEGVLYRPYNTLSHGEQTKVQLAALFLREDDCPLIDEPTNHLDMQGRGKLAEYLRSKKGFILVSHDRRFLDGSVDHILAINKTGMQVVKGGFTTWQQQKQMQDAFEIGENEKRKSEIKRLSDAARRTAGWSDRVEATKIGEGAYDRGAIGHKAAKMMKRAKSIETRRQAEIEEKSKLLKDIEYNSPLILRPLSHHAQRLASVEDLHISFGTHNVVAGISFSIEQGQRIALQGGNGSGKSSILKIIMGEDLPHTGTVALASGLKISYVPQDTSFLRGDLGEYAKQSGIDESLFKTILRKLDFMRVQFEKDMRDLSRGQQKKVLIAKSLCERAHLYIWDEPLNYVDVLSRVQIEELLEKYQPSMLFVEHDAAFVERVATHSVPLL